MLNIACNMLDSHLLIVSIRQCLRFKTSFSKNQSFLEEEVYFRFSKITHLSINVRMSDY